MALPTVIIRHASLAEIVSLRHVELRPGRSRTTAEFDGDHEATTRHFGTFLAAGGAAIACASCMRRPWAGQPAWQLRGMATRSDLVRRGLGTALLDFALRSLTTESGPALWWCNARTGALPFYRRHGWVVASDAFEIEDVGEHYAMVRPAGAQVPPSSTNSE